MIDASALKRYFNEGWLAVKREMVAYHVMNCPDCKAEKEAAEKAGAETQ